MSKEISGVEPGAKLRLQRPRWSYYKKDKQASLHDAVSLSLNVSPGRMAALVRDSTAGTCGIYLKRVRAARLEMIDGGDIKVLEKGVEHDGRDWIIDLKSFVIFALARNWGNKIEDFKLLGTGRSLPIDDVKTSAKTHKSTVGFVAALIRLLVEIARRAALKGEEFNVCEMPGVRTDLHELAEKNDVDLRCAKGTFETYIKGLCKFKRGARETEFYRNLFPELYK